MEAVVGGGVGGERGEYGGKVGRVGAVWSVGSGGVSAVSEEYRWVGCSGGGDEEAEQGQGQRAEKEIVG